MAVSNVGSGWARYNRHPSIDPLYPYSNGGNLSHHRLVGFLSTTTRASQRYFDESTCHVATSIIVGIFRGSVWGGHTCSSVFKGTVFITLQHVEFYL